MPEHPGRRSVGRHLGAGNSTGRGRRLWLLAGIVALVIAAIVAGATWASSGRPNETMVGILEATPPYFAAEHADGLDLVTLDVIWAQAEPEPGRFSDSYLAGIAGTVADARRDGLEVSLDIGLQYAPAWVFALPGGTRFVNQYHQRFGGSPASGNEVANGVTDPAVRAAEGQYLRRLGQAVIGSGIQSVREGGGPFGELRYPGPVYGGHRNCWWAFDASSQKVAALRYVPGTGSVSAARRFLTAYNHDLVHYGIWLDDQVARDFATSRLLLLPGWGERPGTEDGVVGSRLQRSRPEFNEGLDWAALLSALRHPSSTVLYTTYLNAPTIRDTPQLESPIAYLAFLDGTGRFRLGGENSQAGSQQTMNFMLQLAASDHLSVVNWLAQSQLVTDQQQQRPGAPTLASYGRAAAVILGRGF
jgi:hypothetical protein